jgi:LAS superfamily LD-carboxypeptidase LdcB
MNENAHKYGFYRVYTNNKLRAGYKYESWHYSFRKLSKPMLAQYNQLDLVKILKKEIIAGNKYFTPLFIKKYKEDNVLGINDYLY